jgi:plasmid stabilization system protein ParE
MSAYVLTPLAKADIFDIWIYIAENSENAADRVEQAIYDACAFLVEGPLRGHTRPDPPRQLRFWTLGRYPNYTVVYRPDTAPPSNRCRSPRKAQHPPFPQAAHLSAHGGRYDPKSL